MKMNVNAKNTSYIFTDVFSEDGKFKLSSMFNIVKEIYTMTSFSFLGDNGEELETWDGDLFVYTIVFRFLKGVRVKELLFDENQLKDAETMEAYFKMVVAFAVKEEMLLAMFINAERLGFFDNIGS